MADPLGALASASTAQCAAACLRLASSVAPNAQPSMRERTWKNARHPHTTPARAIDPSHYSLSGDAGADGESFEESETSVRGRWEH